DGQLQNEKNVEDILAVIDGKLLKSLHDLTIRFNLPIAEGAFHDSYKDQHNLKDTNEIAQWAQASKSKCIFWLNGMAGTGKSTIARTVAQSFKESEQLEAIFFFKKGEADRGTVKLFIPTIMKQLIAYNQRLAQAALREQFRKFFLKPLQSVGLISVTTLVIVIDALDECENAEEISVILEHLPQTQDSHNFEDLPHEPTRKSNSLLHDISDASIEHDISLFLQDRFVKVRSSEIAPEGWPRENEIQTLLKMTVPSFISAATVCRFIENERLDPVERLTELLENQARYVTKMDKTYLPILTRLVDGQHDDEKKLLLQRFQQIVGVIILLAIPVSARTIGVHLNWFQSALSIPSDQDLPVRILHLSFRDFLLATISELQYSCRYWVYHLERSRADNTKEENSERDILGFLQQHFLHWLEAMSLVGMIRETVEVIGKLHLVKQRFLLKNLYMTETAPLQVYSSGLVFSPTESIVRKHFEEKRLQKTLKGHSDSVNSMAFSPDSQTVASGSSDNTIKLWDARMGKELQTLEGHADSFVGQINDWIAFRNENLIWLPAEYRKFPCSAIQDGNLALGYPNGRVFIICFRAD
ncbi:hypothetical protein N7507_004694, partial [Penicillium longicatenatum]